MYDIEVERTHNFVVNGLSTHNTRWHEDDFIGRLLSTEHEGNPDDWEVIEFPALADQTAGTDAIDRATGDPLISPLVDETREQALARWQDVRTAVGTYVWSALYQQRPSPAKGAIFDTGWWRYWTTDPDLVTDDGRTILLPPNDQLARGRWVDSWDMAFKATATSDWVVGQRWVRLGAKRLLIAQQRDRWTFTESLAAMRRWASGDPIASPYGHLVHQRLVEEKANGAAIIDSLKEELAGIKAINPDRSKQARARAITPEVESGHCYLPHPSQDGHEWVGELLDELRDFPNAAHDDQVDSLTQALSELRGGSGVITVPGSARSTGRNGSGITLAALGNRSMAALARTDAARRSYGGLNGGTAAGRRN